jgi:putative oxidoreductase
MSLIVPQLGSLYDTLTPWAELLLRVVVGLALIAHGLRMTFGFFPNSGGPIHNLAMLAKELDNSGYRPSQLWAPLIAATQLIGGPMFALGLLTRPVAVPIVIFLCFCSFERARVNGYFWTTLGVEYPLMWTAAALFFLVHGGGIYSLDHLVLGREF